ncbi:MAG: hypothetical protein JSV44_04160 [Candidatus Zixiibacteriota bacterium]|nr:MAG: hypothetical protein JSV44_04160 [candidate division Zixibacteria bacterium]
MTLYESTDGLERLNSNGVSAYIDPRLKEHLSKFGNIRIDYVINDHGEGYAVTVGDLNCADGCHEKGCGGH